jgi:adenosylmethionine-8-amino-7-oxononanoate aminotransferase
VNEPGRVPAFLHPFSKPSAPASSYLEMVRGDGATVTDAAGRTYVDALAALWFCQVGHGRREILDAIRVQSEQLATWHTFDRFTNGPAEALTAELAELAPMPDARVFLTTGGSEAVESAIKLARLAHFCAGEPERTVVISRAPSYHGVTFGSLALTGLPANQAGFGPLVGDVVQVPADDLDALDRAIDTIGAHRVAAVVAEPVIGAGGVLPPSDGYLAGLRQRCDASGAFLVLDEVICGFGRLGAWFGAERYGVRPDLVSFAKGVSSGYLPVGGVLVGADVRARLEADPDLVLRHGHTYSGHPTACAAAVANLGVLRDEGLLDRADPIGKRLGDGLRSVAAGGDRIVEVRGVAGVWAVQLAEGIDAQSVRDGMLERGVIARNLGPSVIAFCPPLVISDEQLDQCVEALAGALRYLD